VKKRRKEGGAAALIAKRQKTIIVPHSTQTLFLDVQAEILSKV
jgi:hypothetical protein